MALRRVVRVFDWVALVLVAWAGLAMIPAQALWFDPGDVVVSSSDIDHPPVIFFEREIKRPARISYSIVVRVIGTQSPVCAPTVGPFEYRPDATLPDPIDLVWWTGGDDRCWPRDPGEYIMETCWTVVSPFWGAVPPKTVCRTSNPFTIAAVAQGEAQQAIDAQRSIQRQIEGLERQIETLRGTR